MQLRVGYEIVYGCTQPTPMILTLSIHYSRASDIIRADHLITRPALPLRSYRDGFGNWCSRILARPGLTTVTADALIHDDGAADPVVPDAPQHAVQDLPEETLVFLLGSRYCETDRLSAIAWSLFGHTPTGWARVQAICNFVHCHIAFGYEHADPTKTAWQVYHERRGVCRDFAHLALAFCRCMNIPARYCTGYLSDVGLPPPYSTMDFAGWFEAYLGGQWYLFDPRNNEPRKGRVLIARGRDAADVAISTAFGVATLESFKVWADEVNESAVWV